MTIQRFPDTPEMIKASTFLVSSNIHKVRERVYELLDLLETTESLDTKLNLCMCLEPYGIHMAGTEHGPTELEYAEHIQAIKSWISEDELNPDTGEA